MKVFEFENIIYYVGQNAKENWEILDKAKLENSQYLWFHLNSFKSPYVILWLSFDKLKHLDNINKYINYGANLCKEYSKYKYLKDLKIIYTIVDKLYKTNNIGEVDIKGKYSIIKL